jgi:hypothetical protein
MIRILLCGEGTTDQGRKDFIDGEYVNSDGVLQTLIKKVSPVGNLTFVVKTRQDLKSTIKLYKHYYGKQTTNSKKLAIAANNENCTHIAYHRDEDSKGLKEMYDQVQGYFEDAKKKGINCIAIVPMHMTENWLLADKNAYPAIPVNPELPSRPEETWGSKGTDTHPKKYLERVLAQFPQYKKQALSKVYAEIAEKSDIEILRRRCPESFDKKFYMDMQSFIPQETGIS